MILYTMDCETTAYRIIGVTEYDKAGNMTGQWPKSEFTKEVSYPVHDSNMSEIIDAACDRGFDIAR